MRKHFFKSRFIVALSLSLSMVGCSDYLDVDTDTDAPVSAPIEQLLPNIQQGVGNFGDHRLWSGVVLSVYTHQFTTREDPDQYGTRPSYFAIENEWDNVYLTLTDIESLITTATESGDMQYAGVAQLMKAFLMASAVDLWGDVPYTEATQLEGGIISATFDEQTMIYQSVLDLIDTAKANINSDEGIAPGDEDLFYAGNMDQWIRFANTFKLKLYNQIKTTSLFDQSAFDALVSEDNFFQSSADDFEFLSTTAKSPTDERNELWKDAYLSTQFGNYISPWMYEILKGWNPRIFTGIEDPRIPYFWVNQLKDGQLPLDQGDAETGNPNADYWDEDTGFFSIRFGSIGPDRDHSVENSATYPGIFPAGGLYDENEGYTIGATSGTGLAPHRILTYDEFLYIQAELIHEGYMSGDAQEKLGEAMEASFEKVDEISQAAATESQDVPILSGSDEVTAYIDAVLAAFEGASKEKQLEIIMTQKWVSTFGDHVDQYNDYRRTGYPILADPLGPGPEYQLDMGDFPLDDGVTVQNSPFQVSLYWPQNELNLNQNAPAQKDTGAYKIFWDN
ncbi:MAG: SusD/RagB family nutrient-binding outer membrane lipoprotein [Candidatus Bathyarchaeota archaeon]|nr:SusD/RagB family nutrient-binding outer membrane lipoprotein [Candidatus Bathyarchaeota archaeon]